MVVARIAAVVFLDLAISCKPIQKSFSNESVFLRPLMTSDRSIVADFFMPLLIANAKRQTLREIKTRGFYGGRPSARSIKSMSAFGPKRTSLVAPHMSAARREFRGLALA